MKNILKSLWSFFAPVMSDPRRLMHYPSELVWFYQSLAKFKAAHSGEGQPPIKVSPVFFQRQIPSTYDAHYVYQAAWATRRILALKLESHTDISSNIPFISTLSASVPVKFYEFRPPTLALPGLELAAGDILNLPIASQSVKSLSCLHVIEHIGLGRYGDPLDPDGMKKACAELGRLVAPGGSLFLSTPVGKRCTYFNVHRVSDPLDIPELFGSQFKLKEFSIVTDSRDYKTNVDPRDYREQEYACGLYWFERV